MRPPEGRKRMLNVIKRIIMGAGSFVLAACAGERPVDLGVHEGRLKSCPGSPNCISSQSPQKGSFVSPLGFAGDPDAAFARLKRIIDRRADSTVIEESGDYLRVEFRTGAGFVDDGEFMLDRSNRVIQLRSASRVGYSDLGKNRRRMEEIRSQLAAPETP